MESVYQFIRAVEKFGELYDKGHRFFNHTARKESIWKSLSTKYKVNAKVKWTYLRERYSREKKKCYNSGDQYRSTWHLYPYLNFLDQHVKQRDRRSTKWNFNSNENNEGDKEIKEVFPPYVIDENSLEKRDKLPWSEEDDEEPKSADATNDASIFTHNLDTSFHDEKLSKEEIPLTEFLDFTHTNNDKSSKRIYPKTESTAIIHSPIDVLDEIPQKIIPESADDAESEDWHFLQSLKYKMRKMHDEEKTQFKIEMLLQAEKAVSNSKKNNS